MLALVTSLALAVGLIHPPVVDSASSTMPFSAVASNRILDATQMEYSPDFTDLYLIETPDRSRLIKIYCNSSSCYKVRGIYKYV